MAAEREMGQRDRREGMRVRGRSRLPAGLGFGGVLRPRLALNLHIARHL